MKKFSKYIFAACAFCLGLMSCSDTDEYTPGVVDPGAYLYSDSAKYMFLPGLEQTLIIKVGRTDLTSNSTVHLGCDNSNFNVPETVTIPSGKKNVEVPVSFNMEIGTSENVRFFVKEDHASAYGYDTISVNVLRDYTWEKLGVATITSEFYGAQLSADMYKAKEGMVYRIIEPYFEITEKTGCTLTFELTEDGQHLAKEIKPVKTTHVHEQYGDIFIRNTDLKEHDITRDGNVITLPLEFIVSVGSFGWYNEVIELPSEE